MADTQIFKTLEPVRQRQRTDRALRGASIGWLAGSVVAVVIGVVRLCGVSAVPISWAIVALAGAPVAGLLAGLVRGRSWGQAASAVDSRYALKDRVLTALEFLRQARSSPIHELQVADAAEHLAGVDARRVVPLGAPRTLPWAVGVSLIAFAVLFWPRPTVEAKPATRLDVVLATADDARDSLEALEEAAEQQGDKDLKILVKQLHDKIEEMKQPGVDVREALAKLSEMQKAISAQQALYNVGAVDAQMKGLGDAVALAKSLEAAGHALQQEKYKKAADDLEAANPEFDRREEKALREELKKVAQASGAAGVADLSESVEELSESLGDANGAAGSLKKLGKLARSHGRRKDIVDLLRRQAQSLSECKGNCQKNSLAQIRGRTKSTKPTSNWGRGISGNVDGEKTALGAARKEETLKGQMGEGPSETETTHSPEGRELAGRNYRETYQKYRKLTEAALNSEPIPLGHRQTIRRYFELIRPQGDETERSDAKASPLPAQ